MKNKICWILDFFSTKRDANGNCYHGVMITNCQTGRYFLASIDGVGNMEHAAPYLPGSTDKYDKTHVHFTYHLNHPFRAYERLFKNNYLTGENKAVAATIVQLTGGYVEDTSK